uniref:Raptor N-terminal CASPase-like domain-containing protein n=1 Tax=Panagrolaimus sp. PS1159 TaxID=55785 RepID=A0AC35FHC8_9BILA
MAKNKRANENCIICISAIYKAEIDPTIDYFKRLCISLRKNATKEWVLFHFNGHGVPKPTEAGEIWVFNKNITQYIPVSK